MLKILIGDIVEQHVDAVVNAANCTLMGGGGVDGAIHVAAGRELVDECFELPLYPSKTIRDGGHVRCDFGEAKITKGYKLFAKHVIHTVGPIYGAGDPDGYKQFLLASAYRNCLSIVKEHGLKSVAFPSISTGAFGYPVGEASQVALEEIHNFLTDNLDVDVTVVCFDVKTFKAYQNALTLLEKKNRTLPYKVVV